jgi:hypothetical protein
MRIWISYRNRYFYLRLDNESAFVPTVEKKHCSSLEMYTSFRSCWIMVLVQPIHVFGELYLKLQYS